jgi:hypothetical protein
MIELPEVPAEVVAVVPSSIATAFRILPVAGDFQAITVLPADPLSPIQLENLQLMMGRTAVVVAEPERYPELYRHIDALLGHYYPPERTPMLMHR